METRQIEKVMAIERRIVSNICRLRIDGLYYKKGSTPLGRGEVDIIAGV